MTMPGSNFVESSPFLLLLLLGYCLAMIEGELRCYCNESGCVATGYMCKSSAAKCFTALEIRDEVTHLTHGCLENLSQEHQRSCRVSVDVISASSADWTSGNLPLLLCCTEHMCNYREDIDVSVILTSKHNGTFNRGRSPPANQDNAIYSRSHHRNSRDEERDMWFKAAVIAVPIAGGVILVLLVLLAVRMLRSDSRHHRRLIQIRQERSLTKAQLYISEHFSNKCAKQHCSLFNEKTNRSRMPLFSSKPLSNNDDNPSGNVCGLSHFGDTSNSNCSNTTPNENLPDTDTSLYQKNTGLNSQSLTSISSTASSPPENCSTNGEVCNNVTSAHSKPCSFFTDFHPAQNTTLQHSIISRDTVVNLNNKCGQTLPHATKLALSGTFGGPGHPFPLVSTHESSCQNGPAIV